ncbi:hypothetical protein [Allosphingosinicella indica]|uniref:Uncharacterized protein n=1 Tax=Allosphingosinicella indica TaxID=941907 RepID=A0A1X7FZL9_9SPHN|nr:hypothetical protein [Allosphingosinicella indica]SMF61529.1 hypothetical protein SAMN06295910_0519 [Allosphingosinicella indica]
MVHRVIDGTIQVATLKRETRRRCQFQDVTLLSLDGLEVKFRKLTVPAALAGAIAPGTSGRFYLHGLGARPSVHGVRTHDGQTGFGFSRGAEWAMLIAGAVAMIAAAVALMVRNDWCLGLALHVAVLATIATLLFRRSRIVADRTFRADLAQPARG